MRAASAKLRGAAAGALSVGAKVMSLSAHLMEGLSGALRPQPETASPEPASPDSQGAADAGGLAPEGPGPVAAPTGEVTTARAPAEAEATPTEPVPDVPEHARTYDTHIEALADKPAAQVIRAVEQLSTDELERLYTHEQGNRRRKTVLAAIERSLSPERSQP